MLKAHGMGVEELIGVRQVMGLGDGDNTSKKALTV